jgi:hypothetical protein
VVEGALEVPEDALCGRKMGLTGVVHMEAHLLDHVGDGEGEVLDVRNRTLTLIEGG